MFAKLLAGILMAVLAILLSIAVMIWGWGLEPQSWEWIIWGYIGTLFLATLGNIISSS